jgi:protein-L-isoaspartate(D-aspartate) O-methyltransferase
MSGLVDALAAAGCRARMVERIRRLHPGLPGPVIAALGRVPRHQFAPGSPLEVAYDPFEVVQLLRDETGATVSSVSAPSIQAIMLDQLDVRPGMRVLEVGSGGYDAALLSELVGPTGLVVTMDIDRRVTDRARTCLAATGYDYVIVLDGEAAHGAPDHAPFDRVLVTVGVYEVAGAWADQLTAGGRIVAPLELRAVTRSVVLTPGDGGVLQVSDAQTCGFVPMRGVLGASGAPVRVEVDDEGSLVSAPLGHPGVDPDGLRAAVDAGPQIVDTGVHLERIDETLESLDLLMDLALPESAFLGVTPQVRDAGEMFPGLWTAYRSVTAVGGSLAVLAGDGPAPVGQPCDLVVLAYGPHGSDLARGQADIVQAWDAAGRPHPLPGDLRVRWGPGAPTAGAVPLRTRDVPVVPAAPAVPDELALSDLATGTSALPDRAKRSGRTVVRSGILGRSTVLVRGATRIEADL